MAWGFRGSTSKGCCYYSSAHLFSVRPIDRGLSQPDGSAVRFTRGDKIDLLSGQADSDPKLSAAALAALDGEVEGRQVGDIHLHALLRCGVVDGEGLYRAVAADPADHVHGPIFG